MGRYSTEPAGPAPVVSPSGPGTFQIPNSSPSYLTWPGKFEKSVIGIDLNGTIIEDNLLTGPESIKVLPGAIDGIRIMRLKGYKVVILSDQPDISTGKITSANIDSAFAELMKQFGQGGIQSIEGFLYNMSEMKEDDFAKPNLGMVRRAEKEILKDKAKFKNGWYVGDSLVDLKFADKMGANPVLVRSGKSQHALEQLEKFTYKDLKSKTKIFQDLHQFAISLT